MTSLDNNKLFIASQGPIMESAHDFWKLVWNNNTNMIVMLCNLVEGKSVVFLNLEKMF